MSIPCRIPDTQIEKYSSAITLSDMEVFIFPELLYSLVLANIMSPRLWEWKEDKWFRKLAKKSPYRRIQRLKQFIIDHYEFNLDLETWGLTTKEQELARFKPWVDEKTLSESNALFGYEGDRYYFSLDIRKHFGLDKYDTDVIPYWKTETLEAMDAFRFKTGYKEGAGECVSLSTLYAAALFVVCGISLEDIFLMATPLHSQNFINIRNGILTNNRRLVTRNMWFNGTELTAKAQRALRNERVTIVAHHTGYIHMLYPRATIDAATYRQFEDRLQKFLSAEINMEILLNFLRQHRDLQECFQFEYICHGKPRYVPMENVYHYEHSSPYLINADTRENLLADIDEYACFAAPMEGRILLNKFEHFFHGREIHVEDRKGIAKLADQLGCRNQHAPEIIERLIEFVHITPRLPSPNREYEETPVLDIHPEMQREEIIARLSALRETHTTADLAFYAFRDLAVTDWRPFLKAALERNPVCIDGARDMPDLQVIEQLCAWPNESIYDGTRVAQPDEVWNYQRGDGLERAFCLAAILKARHPEKVIHIECEPDYTLLTSGEIRQSWPSSKRLKNSLTL